jgi:hypothetical protein
MKSLFSTSMNWYVFVAGCALLVLIPGLSLFSYLALVISLHQFLLLFYNMNNLIPVRYFFGFLMCLQMFIGPSLAYAGLDEYQYFVYRMQIPADEYFSYVLPAVIMFILGLHFKADNMQGEIPNVKEISEFADKKAQLPYILIGLGFVCSILTESVASELGFLFYLLAQLKFIGFFILILSKKTMKTGMLVLVFGSVISSSLGQGMFHDLLTWLIFLGSVYAIKYKPNTVVKIACGAAFVFLVVVIQSLKSTYREAIAQDEGGLETFTRAYEEKQAGDQGFLSFSNLAPSLVRINQGFIVTNIMKTVPEKEPFSGGGELMQLLEAAFLPRIIAPNKLKAGDRTLFEKYSGIHIREGTSMGLSSVGDAYLNFGVFGGWIFMFVLGSLYNFTLKQFEKYSKLYPLLLIFTPMVFFYPIRPDCELQTILGHLVKSCFVVYLLMMLGKRYFKESLQPSYVS